MGNILLFVNPRCACAARVTVFALCVCACVCVCVCVCGGENERGRKESMGERDVATETGGGTCQRHQSIGPPDTHSCWAWTHKP